MSLPLEQFLIFSTVLILLSWAMYLPYRCGQLYLAVVYCMATGGYFAAYAATAWGWPPWLALVASPLVGAFFAFIPALGLRRAPGFTTAIASLALIFILQTVIMNLKFLGGQAGLFGIPLVEHLLTVSLSILLIAGVLVYRLDHSRFGRAAELLYYSREEAGSFGINMDSIGLFLQVAAGTLSGVAGAIYAFSLGAIFPAAFSFPLLLLVFPILFIGGTFTMWGPLVFAPVLWGIPLILPERIAEWKDVIYGALLIVILIIRPEGVISKQMVRRVRRGSSGCVRGLKRAGK